MLILYRQFVNAPGEIVPDRDELQHLKALRIKDGSNILIGDGSGRHFHYTLNSNVLVYSGQEPVFKKDASIILCTAVPSTNRWDWLLQKATELGVTEFYPVQYRRSEKRNVNQDRAVRIIKEAASQSGRYFLPVIHPLKKPAEILNQLPEHIYKIYLSPYSETGEIHDIPVIKKETPSIALFIGPEGGFDQTEIDLFGNMKSLKISENILRVETAALASISIINYLLNPAMHLRR